MAANLLFVGDTHTDLSYWDWLLHDAELHNLYFANTIIQVGDFGYWPRWYPDGAQYLSELDQFLDDEGVELYFIDGNHEDHESLIEEPLDEVTGLRPIGEHITHIPRSHMVTLGGYKILGLGGAYSIDQGSLTQGVDWFPEEMISYGDVLRTLDNKRPDIMVTHDCPEEVPHKLLTRLYPIAGARSQRMALQAIYDEFRPSLWIHGHYHQRYTWHSESTRFEGLGANFARDKSWMIVPEKRAVPCPYKK